MFVVVELAALLVGTYVTMLALALMWRIGGWVRGSARSLIEDEGLRVGSRAPELAGYEGSGGTQQVHLSFDGGLSSFVAFGGAGCQPCKDLIQSAVRHPAARHWRLVYVAGGFDETLEEDLAGMPQPVLDQWEIYRFHDEERARDQWRAPVSPYFHLIDPRGRVLAKGLANRPEHLDRLVALVPLVPTPASQS